MCLRYHESGFLSLSSSQTSKRQTSKRLVSGTGVTQEELQRAGFPEDVARRAGAQGNKWRTLQVRATALAAKAPADAGRFAASVAVIARSVGVNVELCEVGNDKFTAVATSDGELALAVQFSEGVPRGPSSFIEVLARSPWWLLLVATAIKQSTTRLAGLGGHWRFSADVNSAIECDGQELDQAIRALIAEHRHAGPKGQPWTDEQLGAMGLSMELENWERYVPAADLGIAVF